ncbi:MAG TPA: hypothetical protein VI279_05460 [Rhodocyclaceae bacterium]
MWFGANAYAKNLKEQIVEMTAGNMAGIPEKCYQRVWEPGVGEGGDEDCLRSIAEHMPTINPNNRESFGEYYDPKKWADCWISRIKYGREKSADYKYCPVYILRRPENPEYWPNPKAPPQWPEAPKESVYREGMTQREYFEALCKAEAGEFIYKTVPHVEGYYVARPRKQDSDEVLSDRYVVEDPWGIYGLGDGVISMMSYIAESAFGNRFVFRRFIEKPFPTGGTGKAPPAQYDYYDSSFYAVLPPNVRYERVSDYDGYSYKTARMEYTNKLKSRYAISWRGIRRPHDRELVIAGGEFGIFDLANGELLGLRRQFMASAKNSLGKYSWLNGAGCPQFFDPVSHKRSSGDFGFLLKVLQPINDQPVTK